MTQQKEVQNIIHMEIDVYGRVTQSDIIGAVFGQTEDVLGEDLELRGLQKSGEIGRIEVEIDSKPDKTRGLVIIPSMMDRVHTVIIATALETIEKIGPCRAAARCAKIENIKEIKVKKIIVHAKNVLQKFMTDSVDSQELVDRVSYAVREDEMIERDGVPIGRSLKYYDEAIFVETVADLKTLLRYGIQNVVAFEDLSHADVLKEISEEQEVIVFINRGKEHFIEKLMEFCDLDSMTRPDSGKKITQLTSKELHKAIRAAFSVEQFLHGRQQYQQRYSSPSSSHSHLNTARQQSSSARNDKGARSNTQPSSSPSSSSSSSQARPRRGRNDTNERDTRSDTRQDRQENQQRLVTVSGKQKEFLNSSYSSIDGSKDALLFDESLSLLGKIPVADLSQTLAGLAGAVYGVVTTALDAPVVHAAEKANVTMMYCPDTKLRSRRVTILGKL